MLLLTDLTNATDYKSIGIEYCRKIREKLSPILALILNKYRRYCWYQYQY